MKSRSKTQNNQIVWILLAAILLIFMIWMHVHGYSTFRWMKINLVAIFLQIIIYSLFTFILTRSLGSFIRRKRTRYRIAFLSAVGVGILLVLSSIILLDASRSWHCILWIILCSFCGGFLASSLEFGLWENNAPPTHKVEHEVLARHQEKMGSQPKKSLSKRILDVLIALISLVISAPIWLIVVFLIWWEDPGPIFFVKNSVGRGGKNFHQLKFRSMIIDAEKDTGPISGYENDERVLFFGKMLRKTALDELPQLINILLGDMSYVGPRPQRTVLVHGYLQDIPDYAKRHLVRPGLAGLAQVVDTYDISPEQKLAWDLVYIENVSIWLDIKLVLAAFYLVFALRWRSGTNPEMTIRNLLKVSEPRKTE